MLRIRQWICCFLLCLLNQVSVAGNPILIAQQPRLQKGMDISQDTKFYIPSASEDPSVSEVKKRSFLPMEMKRNERSEGLNGPTMITWLSFSIKNTGTSDSLHFLYDCHMQYLIEVYQDDSLIGVKGLSKGPAGRSLVELIIPPRSVKTYLIKITNYYQAVLPIISVLQTDNSFYEGSLREVSDSSPLFFFLSLMSGCFLFMGIYSLYYYYLNRDRSFLFYSIYSFIIFFNSLVSVNLRFGLTGNLQTTCIFLIPVSYTLFLCTIVQLPVRKSFARKLLQVLLVLAIVQQFISWTETGILHHPLLKSMLYYNLSLWPGLLMIFISSYFVFISRHSFRSYLITGILCMVGFGFIPFLLNPYFHIENRKLEAIFNYPASFWEFGITVENICFAMALAWRRKLEEQKINQLKTDFNKQLLATEMTALRAQMNPHFIFNCLNSIKLYTLENNASKAAEYLTKFSRLIRLVLENSREEKISLAVELETLQLYIDMETMRFKDKFAYQVIIDPETDPEYIDLPPLLIQPYIENAIWHGLMHKEGQGKVTVSIKQPEEHQLLVEITDDGVGRLQAAEYKSKSAVLHKSFGMKMNSDRIMLINQMQRNATSIEIIDLTNEKGHASGTKVALMIAI